MKNEERVRKDRIAQWAFDTRPLLLRFHLWLEDIEVEWLRGEGLGNESAVDRLEAGVSFMDQRMERLMILTQAITAMGTQLYGRYGEAAGLDKAGLNRVKKDADAISAYAMSECLWHATRHLPENHAVLVCLGEGLMPKGGETEEMGSNPLLGFGRVYARPQVARWLDDRVQRLLNDDDYDFDAFYGEVKLAGVTIWGAAIDTLECTSRFAKGEPTGPMSVLHLFDQPLAIQRPYEGYMGTLVLPRTVIEHAQELSLLVDYRTPRDKVFQAIAAAYPGIKPEHVHVWTLRGGARGKRIGTLWAQWEAVGAHLIDDGWMLQGRPVFTDSGTYAPNFAVGAWEDDGETHVLICDGYAASAEAMQAASLAPSRDLDCSLAVMTSKFALPWDKEPRVMALDPTAPSFAVDLGTLSGELVSHAQAQDVRRMMREVSDAGLPRDKRVLRAEDFFPEKRWEGAALVGYMKPDPYSGAAGIEQVAPDTWKATVRVATPRGDKWVTFTLRSTAPAAEAPLVFQPLLIRFLKGEDYTNRPVKVSDSGRIRNELQTLASEALEHLEHHGMRLHFDRIPEAVMPPEHHLRLREILTWYKTHHPVWFEWLEIR